MNALIAKSKTLSSYTPQKARGDLFAGLTVGIILVPQGMAYAMLGGLPPVYGLYASLVPLFVYAILGSSKHLAIGLNAIDMLLVSTAIGALAIPGSPLYVQHVLLLAMTVGAIQVLLGVLRFGFLANFISRPVVAGFLSAAPIIIAFSQLGNLLGVDVGQSFNIFLVIDDLMRHISSINMLSATIGIASILGMYLLKRKSGKFPATLLVVFLGLLLGWCADLPARGVEIVGDIPRDLPRMAFPNVPFENFDEILTSAIALALIQMMTLVSLGRAFDDRNGDRTDVNREIFSIGASNFCGGLFQCAPVSVSFSRSIVNFQSGAQTRFSNAVAAAVIAMIVVLFTPYIRVLPVTTLAAIIFYAAIRMVSVTEILWLIKTRKIDGYIAILTFVVTLTIGIEEGVFSGILVSMIVLLHQLATPKVVRLGWVEEDRFYRDIKRFPDATEKEGILVLRIDSSFSFANAQSIRARIIERCEEYELPLKALVIDMSGINDVDASAVKELDGLFQELSQRGIAVYISRIKSAVQDILRKAEMEFAPPKENFMPSVSKSIKKILAEE